ncbi:hypothetical protein K432DRAFT_382138 [Lepidopterella palustris CBS 459.81]|uniref:FR47-like domain-containing protein n=1 Tax=Lepidopterella palustris CBS 459.81 TaxID=1314670 RepID=A0A8E2EB00_9PEZI|nr:hypothetical protein K432DRAFT_382138 [Lepidopterella palustris CBS 459.81]
MSLFSKVYEHPVSSSTLLKALRIRLPYSLPLYRRLQSQIRSPHAHVLATFPPGESQEAKNDPQELGLVPQCFAAVFFDRSVRPETEMWAFVSGEMPEHDHGADKSTSNSSPSISTFHPLFTTPSTLSCPNCTSAFLSVLAYASTLEIPDVAPENKPAYQLALANATVSREIGLAQHKSITSASYLAHLLCRSVITLGTLHSSLRTVLTTNNVVRTEFPGLEMPYRKFIFRKSDFPALGALPEGLRWGAVRAQDLKVIQASTSIPRSSRTLLSLKSAAIYPKDSESPIAWAFLGLDGSLTSLHVQATYRGQGLAKAVTTKLFREHMSSNEKEGEQDEWAHADVFEGNVQSEGVCKSLGGKAFWTVFWVRLDLDRAKVTNSEAGSQVCTSF